MKNDKNFDWSSLNDKVEDILGRHFWNDLHDILPKRFPNIDLYQTDTEGIVVMEIPGLVSSTDVQIRLESNNLIIQGEIPYPYPYPKKQLPMQERYTGKFERSIRLPFHYLESSVTAKYRAGLLEVRVQKDPQKQTIPISFEADIEDEDLD
ncbi:Hsp20/alpha crystallin family protein [Priestia koreensis]|uniref:Heat-shock protein n=1 Tax=Priestia koreensis TaxID=284581 RepID=A0A0M0L6M7_9BACI|nr:Hsp20/alpha crystallin family protein [Priestia koreensis]KOO46323.1 heat-shock protein [Priestia koreensis]